MSIGIKDKVSQSARPGQCKVCENYTRQIEEVSVTLCGRDAVIKALHNQLAKFEANYRKLFADFEQLRFQHCSALQDNCSLREINQKLTDIRSPDISEKRTKCCKKECPCANLDGNRAVNNARPERDWEKSQFPILDEINNIDKLVNTQYHILKDLIGKVAKEVKLCRSVKLVLEQDIDETGGPFKETESGDHLNANPKFELLAEEIEKLRNLVDQHQKENDRIKQYLLDKRNRLTRCTNILSHFPEINDHKSLLQKDQKISATEMTDETNKTVKDLELEMQQKEQQFEKCCCQLIEQLNEIHDNNQALSDTLSVITQENKNNVEIATNLKNELNRVNDDYEAKIDELKLRIGALENQLDESKRMEKTSKDSAELLEKEIDHLKGRLKNAIDENSNLKSCKCAADAGMTTKLIILQTENDDLRTDLGKKIIEIAEFAEENKSVGQKLDILNKDNAELVNKVRELQHQLDDFQVVKQDVSNQTSLHQSSVSQQTPIKEEQECLNTKCRQNQIQMLEKLDQLDSLKDSIKLQRDEINKINKENDDLKEEMEALNSRNKTETDRLQELVNHSQNQVAALLKEHDEKTAQFQSVANELDNIRTSITQDNDHLMGQIRLLQQENESLTKENQLIKICQCEEAQDEIDRLKMELCKKQCIILELEKSVDNFNETLRNFDSTADELACENACLQADRARLLKELEIMQQEICVNNAELVRMKNQTQINDKSCSERNEALEKQNEALKNNLLQLNTEKRELEKELINNCHKQMELENMKQDYTRRTSTIAKQFEDLQTAYRELKSLFDQTYAENTRLRSELKTDVASKEDLQQLLKKTEFLQSENEKLTNQADLLKNECNQLRKECATKCLEAFTLKEAVEDEKQQKRLCDEHCRGLKQTQKANEMELVKLQEQLDKMCEKYGQKSEDLKKVQKQWECCAKQCQISRDEYNNLRKEYKDIKAMLTDQIKKYKVDGRSAEAGRNCKVSQDIKEELMQKENEIVTLHQKLKNASCEIIELKDYVQKLICDNHLLKSAINGLISNLENKIKGPSFGSLPSNSAEIIAGEILNSLTTIEDIIVKKGNSCPTCPGKYCDCMSEITQQYSHKSTISNSHYYYYYLMLNEHHYNEYGVPDASKTDLPQAQKARTSICSGTSQHPCEKRLNMERSSQFDCVESCKKLRERLLKSVSENLLAKTSSAQIALGSETNTTDSDDLHPGQVDNK